MNREYKGRSFIPISAQELQNGGVLGFDLYIYLPLNARMLMIRARGQELEPAIVASYQRRGHDSFYRLESSAEAADRAVAEGQAGASGLSAEVPPAQSPMAEGTVVAEAKEFVPGDLLEKAATASEIGAAAPAETTTEISATEINVETTSKAPPEEGNILVGKDRTDSVPEATEIATPSETPEAERSFAAGQAEAETEQSFAPDAQEKEEESFGELMEGGSRRVRTDKEEAALKRMQAAKERSEEQEFSGEEEDLIEQMFDPAAAEAEAEALVKGSAAEKDDTSRAVGREIKGMEEELRSFSPENEEFVEEIRKIEAHQEKPGEEWNVEDSDARLEGMNEEDKAGAKLAVAIGKKLGQLRGELNDASRATPKNADEEAANEARKQELGRQIRELESTSMLLESLDDKEIEMANLPEEIAGKSKLERISHLEKAVKGLAGTDLLAEADSRAIAKKIKKVKANDFDVHGEDVDQARDSLAKRREQMIEASLGALPEVEREELNREIAKKVRTAQVGAAAARELGQKRRELGEVLQRSPRNRAEARANEVRARALQEKIAALENATAAAEAGEEMPDQLVSSLGIKPDADFELRAGEDQAAGLARIEQKLAGLKEEVVAANDGAAEAQDKLMAAINGRSDEAQRAEENQVPLAERGEPIKLTRLEGLAKRKAELEQIAEELGTGAELDDESLGELYAGAAASAEEALMLRKMDATLAEKRENLRQLLLEKKGTSEEKTALEKTALAAMAEIAELERLQDQVVQGKAVPPEQLAAYRANVPPEEFRRREGETPQMALARMAKSLGLESEQIVSSEKKSDRAEEKLRAEIAASELTGLKLKAINTKPIEQEEKRLSRLMKTFLETGKSIDPHEVWEVNRSIAANVQLAKAEVNIAKKISELGNQLASLAEERGGGLEQITERRVKMGQIQDEIMELKKLGDSIDARGPIDYQRISPFLEETPELMILRGEKPTAENMSQVIKGLGALRDELVFFKSDAINALDECMKVKRLQGAEPAEAQQLVSGDDGQQVQLGVYSAALFRAFGYDDQELEFDLMLALYLAQFSPAEVARAFSGRVAALHAAGKEQGQEMLLRDCGQAIAIARAYLQVPQVITGKLDIDAKLMAELCASQQAADFDSELLARAQAATQAEMPASERVRLSDMAQAARVEVSRANLGQN